MKDRLLFANPFLLAITGCLLAGSHCRSKVNHYEPRYSQEKVNKKVLLFGVPSQSFFELTDLFVKYLNKHLIEAQVQTVASSSFGGYHEKLSQSYFQLTIANGMTALNLKNNYSIVGTAVDEKGNSGAIVVNKDSLIHEFPDLKGKTIATAGPPALPGHMLQMVFLSSNGIDVNKDIRLKFFESFESVFLNVYLNKCSAGFSTLTAWNNFIKRRPEIMSRVILKWQTPAIIGNAVMIRKDIDQQTSDQLKEIIWSMHETEEGRSALAKLGYLRFEPADENSYRSITGVVKKYNAVVVNAKN